MKETGMILLVEDDKNIQRTNRRILEREGFTVRCAGTLNAAEEALSEQQPDALVLDIMLPDGNGLAFCEKIRPYMPVPVLFLTALDEKNEIIEGLVAGGNDYITKPYDVDEFVARVKSQIRLARMNRQASEKAKTMTRGPLLLDLVALRAFLEGGDMMLSAREFSVLLFLLKNEGRTLSAEEIYQGAWDQPMAGNSNALWKCISRLKNKLAVCEGRVSLMNFRNKGYLLEIIDCES